MAAKPWELDWGADAQAPPPVATAPPPAPAPWKPSFDPSALPRPQPFDDVAALNDIPNPAAAFDAPPADEPSFSQVAEHALQRSLSSVAQTAQTTSTGKPGRELVAPSAFEQEPISLKGIIESPVRSFKHVLGQTIESSPTLGGGLAGAAIGEGLAPEGGPIGPIVGGAGGMALGNLVQTLGPNYAAALKKYPNDPEAAYREAVKVTAIGTGGTFVSGLLLGANPFSAKVKNLLFQTFGVQPAAMTATATGEQLARGETPTVEGALNAYPGQVAGALVPVGVGEAAHALGGRPATPQARTEPVVDMPGEVSHEPLRSVNPAVRPWDAETPTTPPSVKPPLTPEAEAIVAGYEKEAANEKHSPKARERFAARAEEIRARFASEDDGATPLVPRAQETPSGAPTGNGVLDRPTLPEPAQRLALPAPGVKPWDHDWDTAATGAPNETQPPAGEAPNPPPGVPQTSASSTPRPEDQAVIGSETPLQHDAPPAAGPSRIVAAATRIDGKVYTGRTHADAVEAWMKETGKSVDDIPRDVFEGFVTSDGKLIDRATAARLIDPRFGSTASEDVERVQGAPLGSGDQTTQPRNENQWRDQQTPGAGPKQYSDAELLAMGRSTTPRAARENALRKNYRPTRLAGWLKNRGGIQEYRGELAHMGAHRVRGLVRAKGWHPDYAALMAQEAGYIPRRYDENGDLERADMNDLFEALHDDLGNNPVFSEDDLGHVSESRMRAKATRAKAGAKIREAYYGEATDDQAEQPPFQMGKDETQLPPYDSAHFMEAAGGDRAQAIENLRSRIASMPTERFGGKPAQYRLKLEWALAELEDPHRPTLSLVEKPLSGNYVKPDMRSFAVTRGQREIGRIFISGKGEGFNVEHIAIQHGNAPLTPEESALAARYLKARLSGENTAPPISPERPSAITIRDVTPEGSRPANFRHYTIFDQGREIGHFSGQQTPGGNFHIWGMAGVDGRNEIATPVMREALRQVQKQLAPEGQLTGQRVSGARTGPAADPNSSETGNVAVRMRQAGKDERPGALVGPGKAFFSQLEHWVERLPMKKASGQQWLSTLKQRPGIKADELEATGLADWLNENRDRAITKEEVQQHLDDNAVRFEETVLGKNTTSPLARAEGRMIQARADLESHLRHDGRDADLDLAVMTGRRRPGQLDATTRYFRDLHDRLPEQYSDSIELYRRAQVEFEELKRSSPPDETAQTRTKFESYTEPGGTNYREMLLRTPAGEHTAEYQRLAAERRRVAASGTMGEVGAKLDTIDRQLEQIKSRAFVNNHFSEPNILAHTRLKDRIGPNGEKILHVEEIQSDWHQKGRAGGYRDDAKTKRLAFDLELRRGELERARRAAADPLDKMPLKDLIEAKQRVKAAEEAFEHADREHYGATQAVPDAPFKNTWHELALKRVLDLAAREGYDEVAWTPGQMQAERYDLSRHIKGVLYTRPGPNSEGGSLVMAQHGGNAETRFVKVKDLPEWIGQEASAALLRSGSEQGGYFVHRLDGLDLRAGGEFHKTLYDKKVPQFFNTFGKRFGERVGQTEIRTVDQVMRDPPWYSIASSGDGEFSLVRHDHFADGKDEGERMPGVFKSREDAAAEREKQQHRDRKGLVQFPSFKITEAMREALAGGQPLFQKSAALQTLERKTPNETSRNILSTGKPGNELAIVGLSPREAERFKNLVAATHQIFRKLAPAVDAVAARNIEFAEKGQDRQAHGVYSEDFARPLVAWALEGRTSTGDSYWRSPENVGSTVRHEAIHALYRGGFFKRGEWEALERAAVDGKWIDKHDIEADYGGLPYRVKLEEAIAEEFGTSRPKLFENHAPLVRKAFLRLHALLTQVKAAASKLIGRGDTAANVMRKIESGEVGRRPPRRSLH